MIWIKLWNSGFAVSTLSSLSTLQFLSVPCKGFIGLVQDTGQVVLEDDGGFISHNAGRFICTDVEDDAGRFICTDVEDDAGRFMARVYGLQQKSVGTRWNMSQSNATENIYINHNKDDPAMYEK